MPGKSGIALIMLLLIAIYSGLAKAQCDLTTQCERQSGCYEIGGMYNPCNECVQLNEGPRWVRTEDHAVCTSGPQNGVCLAGECVVVL